MCVFADSQGKFVILSSNSQMNISNDGIFIINILNENDEGKYRCEATNDVEQGLIGDFFLTVHGKIKIMKKKWFHGQFRIIYFSEVLF